MSKVGDRRLLRLAAFLDDLPRKRFDFGEWVGPTWEGDQKLSCGTTACAIGWAATLPEFRRLGLRLTPGRQVVNLKTEEWGEDAVTDIFDLSYDQASYLFIPLGGLGGLFGRGLSRSATPKQVAKHIRRFVADRTA